MSFLRTLSMPQELILKQPLSCNISWQGLKRVETTCLMSSNPCKIYTLQKTSLFDFKYLAKAAIIIWHMIHPGPELKQNFMVVPRTTISKIMVVLTKYMVVRNFHISRIRSRMPKPPFDNSVQVIINNAFFSIIHKGLILSFAYNM